MTGEQFWSGSKFTTDARGSVSLMFGMAVVPVVIALGIAIDYGRFNDSKAQLQTALDATTLALTKTVTASTTSDSLSTPAQKKMAAYMGSTSFTITSGPTLSNNNTELCMSGQVTINATLTGIFNPSATTIKASSCVAASGGGPYEIALVLDNTGSMGETTNGVSKLASAKSAALSLISQLNPPGGTPSASFSIVPFTTSVNVGTKYASASWMDTTGKSSIHWQNYHLPAGASWTPKSRFDLFTATGTTWAGCVEERPDPYLVTDDAPNANTPDTLFVPYLWPDEGDLNNDGAGHLPGWTNGWGWRSQTYSASTYDSIYNNGSQNNYLYDFGGVCSASATDLWEVADLLDSVSQGSGATKVCKYKLPSAANSGVSSSTSDNGPNHNCMSNSLLTLSQDTTTLTNKINSMQAGGDTNLLPGFMWGWRTISPNGPFTGETLAPKAYNAPNNTKAIVFMTDGFNNWSSSNYFYGSEYNAFGYYVNNRLSNYGGTTYPDSSGGTTSDGATNWSNWRSQMDAALLAACANAKAAGIVVFTVGFSIPSDPIDTDGQNLLKKCASDTGKAFIAQDGTALLNAFNAIGIGLGKLRIKS